MPKSTVRKKKVYTPPAELRPANPSGYTSGKPSSAWVPGIAVGLVGLGIAWLVVYYLTDGFFDVTSTGWLYSIGYWNLAIGFGAMVAGLAVFSRWR